MDNDQKKMDDLLRILDELLEYPIETSDDITDAELEHYYNEFCTIYCHHFRH